MAEYTIYSDDSGNGNDRFHALSLIAVPSHVVPELSIHLTDLVRSTGASCTEWKKVGKRSKYTQACKALLGTTNTLVTQFDVLFQTVLWDMHDARHAVQYRDDQSNKEYMYRMALVDLIKRQSITSVTWHPDTDSVMDFDRISRSVMSKILFGPSFASISQSSPEESPFVQLADLSAGLWRNYYEKYEPGRAWFHAGQPVGCPSCSWSKRETEQYNMLLWYVNTLRSGGTPFERLNERLKTPAYGVRPYNVWPYMPQHEADKAPRKLSA